MIAGMQMSELVALLDGELMGANVAVGPLSIDSRTLCAGDLFIALKGPHFDGHRFVAPVAEQGAAAALVTEFQDAALPQLKVADTRLALGQIGQYNRRRWGGPLVAVTGNSGKTSVKEMLAAILSQEGETLATEGNLNNDFGAPLMLSRLEDRHQFAVIELGASAPGEIAYSGALAEPDVAVITNVTGAHLGGFGSMERIAEAKGELIDCLSTQGVVVLNADDAFFADWQARAGARQVLSFGLEQAADVSARALELSPEGSRFELLLAGTVYPLRLPLAGRHQVLNALAAAAAALALDVHAEQIVAGLEAVAPVRGRGQVLAGQKGARLIDDSYNANPGSMRAAVDLLAAYPGRRVLVLGDMAELGPDELAEHRTLGAYARSRGIDQLLATGLLSRETVAGFGAGAAHYASGTELLDALLTDLDEETVVLFKGSRSAQMDRLCQACLASEENN